jgi:hypothetical protein
MIAPRVDAVALAACLALPLAGCGGAPRFDASSDAAARASVERMKSGLSPEAQKQLDDDIAAVALPGVMATAFRALSGMVGGPPPDAADVAAAFRPLDGLTASEIHEKAEAILRNRPGAPSGQ